MPERSRYRSRGRAQRTSAAARTALLDQTDLAIVSLRARMERDSDAVERRLEGDCPALAVAVVQQLAGVLMPQRLGDAVHQLVVDLRADQPLRTDAQRLGLTDAWIRVGRDGVLCEERIPLEQGV